MKKLGMKPKLIILFLLVGLIPLVVVGYWSANKASQSLMEKSFDQLTAVRVIKKKQIEKFFEGRENDAHVMASNPYVMSAFDQLRTAYDTAGGSASGEFKGRSNGEFDAPILYMAVHDRFVKYFQAYMDAYNYADIFLLSPENGDAFFTARKNSDFATPLADSETQLAEVWRIAVEEQRVAISDMEPYGPANGAPVQFVAAPVIRAGALIGVIAFEVPLSSFNAVMQEHTGMGETGQTYLVGQDKLMRSDSSLSSAHTVKASFAGTVKDNGVDTLAVQKALAGETGRVVLPSPIRGEVLSAYGPVTFHGRTWALIAEITKDEVQKPVRGIYLNILIICAVIAVIVAAVAYWMGHTVTKPIMIIQDYSRRVSEGDFNAELKGRFSAELAALAQDIRHMVAQIKEKLSFSQGVLDGFDLIPCAIFNTEHKLDWTNQAMIDFLDREGSPEDFIGIHCREFIYPDNREALSEKALDEQCTMDRETEYESFEGNSKIMHVTSTPFHDMDKNPMGTITVIMDITDIRSQQRLIEDKNKSIEQAAVQAEDLSQQLSSAAEELSAQIEQSSTGMGVQRERTTETASAVEEMNSSIMEVAKNASNASSSAEQTLDKAKDGSRIVREAIEAIDTVQQKTQKMNGSMEELGKQADDIGNIVSVITDIADQTNLLALNAAIEAARAGEAGRGFAVVADEVRKLAEKTMASTKEVGMAISTIQGSVQRNVSEMEESAKAVAHSTELAQSAGDALDQIMTMVESTTDQVRNIATAAEEQSAASEQISRASEEINNIASETADAMDQSSKAVSDLSKLAQKLQELISGLAR